MSRLSGAVQARMAQLGLSVGQVARRSGLSRSTVSDVVNGHRDALAPTSAAALERTLLWRVGSVGEVTAGGQPVEDDGSAELLALYAAADERGRRLILTLLRVIRDHA